MTVRAPARLSETLLGALTPVVFFVAWQLVVVSGAIHFDYLPAPTAIAASFVEIATNGDLLDRTVHTVSSTLVGWLIAAVIGVSAGILLGLSRRATRFSLFTVDFFRPLPGVAFVPLAILVFGFSLSAEVTVIVLTCVWPILINTLGGVRGVHVGLFDVARTFHLSRWALVVKIVVPAALPSIAVALRLGLGLALILAVIAEMVGNPAGLGYALIASQQSLRPAEMWAYLLTIGFLGVALNAALAAVTRGLTAGAPTA